MVGVFTKADLYLRNYLTKLLRLRQRRKRDMSEEKKGELDKVTLAGDKLKKYFPKSYTPKQMEDTIIKLLEGWHKKRTQQQER